MSALGYLYKMTVKNRVRAAFHKPLTMVYVVFLAVYFVFVFFSLSAAISGSSMATPKGFAVILIGWSLFSVPANMLTYAKRKGLLFRPGDTHFVFPAPFSPKLVLLYVQVKNMALGVVVGIVLAVAGVVVFRAPLVNCLLYFLFACIVENVFETSMMVLLYGNERLSERTISVICRCIWLLVFGTLVFAVFIFYEHGVSWETVRLFLSHPGLLGVPVIGWNIAVIRLLFIGPNVVNIICTLLYLACAALLFILALREKCTGEYYEDAAKFADDYQEARQKKKKGETTRIGKKAKYKKATVQYKGTGAKAIFYRQLLEYKKSRFFIFSILSLLCLAGSIAIAIYGLKNGTGEHGVFVILAFGAYLIFCMSAVATKWSKEMENPYTYLIPDTPIRKMWYATLWEHIRSFIDGCLLAFPAGIVWGVSFVQMLLIAIVYTCMQANKLYINVLSQVIVGNILGNTGRQLFQLFLQGIVMCGGVVLGAIGFGISGVTLGFLLLIAYTVFMTVCIGIGASFAFVRVES